MPADVKIKAQPTDYETCVFTLDQPVFPDHSYYFGDSESAKGSPLAQRLLEVPGVRGVLIHHNMITVSAEATSDWYPVAMEIGRRIREVMEREEIPVSPSVLENAPPSEEIRARIQDLFDREINPAIASHGGSVHLIDVRGNEVYIELGGGCQGCAMSRLTLKHGIERGIRSVVPQVGAILDTTDHAAGRNPYYKPFQE